MTIDCGFDFSLNSCNFFVQSDLKSCFSSSWIDLTFSNTDKKSDSLSSKNSSVYTSVSSKSLNDSVSCQYGPEKISKIKKIVQDLQGCISSFQQLLKNIKDYSLQDKCLQLLGVGFDPALTKLEPTTLLPISAGISGSYFWNDSDQKTQFVVKPLDEDAGCINNPKGYISFDVDSYIRDCMPLYKSSLKEAFVYELAKELQLDRIAPKTALMVIESTDFSSYISQQLQNQTTDLEFLENLQQISKRKLCSVQDFIPNTQSLFNVIEKSNYLPLTQELGYFYSLLGLEIGSIPLSADQAFFSEKLKFLTLKFLEIQSEFLKSKSLHSSDIELQNHLFLLKLILQLHSLEVQEIPCSILSNLQDDLLDKLEMESADVCQIDKNEFYRIVQKAFVEKQPLTTNEIYKFEEFFSKMEISNRFKREFLEIAFKNIGLEFLKKITKTFEAVNLNDFSGPENHLNYIKEFAAYLNSRAKWQFDCFFTDKPLDQDDFEEANVLIWTGFDTDAHLGNILCYEKPSSDGSSIYGLKKIDNGLTFPSQNKGLRNLLKYHRNAFEKLSLKSREKILNMNEDSIVEKMKFYGLEYAEDAFRKRISVLKQLASNPDLTIRDIDSMLEKEACK